MHIRRAEVGDAAGIAKVHVETWQVAYRGIVPLRVLDRMSVPDRTTRWTQGLREPAGPTWVTVEEDRISGWATAGPARDQDADGFGELFGIYVDAQQWGTGTGPALMEEALSWLRSQYPKATLWTLEANARARRFYERFGWAPDGTRQMLDFDGTDLPEIRYTIDL